MDGLTDTVLQQTPTAARPLLGMTVLVVEDSRFASEAVRLMCLRSGARIRRADSIAAARRHLSIYRPTVLLVDLGLPDGSGLSLIKGFAGASPRIEVILGTSGDTGLQDRVMAACADGFIPKPVDSLAAFQSEILKHLPADRQPPAPRLLADDVIKPDPIAYQDDLTHIAQVLRGPAGDQTLDYVAQFLGGIARSARDHEMDAAVTQLTRLRRKGQDISQGVAVLSTMVDARLAAASPV